MAEEFESPQAAIAGAIDSGRNEKRTTVWGLVNETEFSIIETAFGQMKSDFDTPGYTKDTGVIQMCSNVYPGGDCVHDSLDDTGGKPIKATYVNYSYLMNGKTKDSIHNSTPGKYFKNPVLTILKAPRADGIEEYHVRFDAVEVDLDDDK